MGLRKLSKKIPERLGPDRSGLRHRVPPTRLHGIRPATLLALLVALLAAVAFSVPNVHAGPAMQCIQENNTIGGVSSTATGTNVTVSWTESYTVPTTLYWGNTTSYLEPSQVVDGSSGHFSVFLDFLEPSTTYYFELSAPRDVIGSLCINSASYNGQWITKADSMALFSGKVMSDTGAHAPAGVYVIASCLGLTGDELSDPSGGVTNSAGVYAIPAPGFTVAVIGGDYACPSGDPYSVQVENWQLSYYNQSSGCTLYPCSSTQWDGYWNASFAVWGLQDINFNLAPVERAAHPIITTAEFSDTGYASVSYCSSSQTTMESQSSTSMSGLLFGVSYSVSSVEARTQTIGSGSCIDNQGEPGWEAWGTPNVTGDIAFDALGNRTPWVAWSQFWGALSDPGNGNVSGGPMQDSAVEPDSPSGACYSNSYDAYIYHYEIVANTVPQSFEFEAGGSFSGNSGETVGVSIPFYLDGTQEGNVGGTWAYSLTTTQSNNFEISINIGGPYPTNHYYTIAGCTSTGTGLTLTVWSDSS